MPVDLTWKGIADTRGADGITMSHYVQVWALWCHTVNTRTHFPPLNKNRRSKKNRDIADNFTIANLFLTES